MKRIDPNKPKVTPILPISPPQDKVGKIAKQIESILVKGGYSNLVTRTGYVTIWVESEQGQSEMDAICALLSKKRLKKVGAYQFVREGVDVYVALNSTKHAY